MLSTSQASLIQNRLSKKVVMPAQTAALNEMEPVVQTVDSIDPISTLLVGLDYIFYVWTFLLVLLVTYLSVCKYFQLRRLHNVKSSTTAASQPVHQWTLSQTALLIATKLLQLVTFASQLVFKCLTKTYRVDSLDWLNNCLKWFYFNADTVGQINRAILRSLNHKINKKLVKKAAYHRLFDAFDIWFGVVNFLFYLQGRGAIGRRNLL